eukprot:scaffold1522_cov340-Prasinococcus_capsulatus_cf.AAC.19
MSINVLSAEIDTIGDIAKVASPHQLVRYDWSTDEFILTAPHKPNEPLSRPMGMLIENALMYYLAKPAVEKDESY